MLPTVNLINFNLLKTLRIYVDKLEVQNNTFWEWEDAIYEGCDMFFQLCNEKQGTVHVDLINRRLTFAQNVSPSIQGITVGLVMGAALLATSATKAGVVLSDAELEWAIKRDCLAKTIAAKRAILEALGLEKEAPDLLSQLEVRLETGNRIYVKVEKDVQARAWILRAVTTRQRLIRHRDRFSAR